MPELAPEASDVSSAAPRQPIRAALLDRLRPIVVALAGIAMATCGVGPAVALSPGMGGVAVVSVHAPSARPALEPAWPARSGVHAVRGPIPVSPSSIVRSGPVLSSASPGVAHVAIPAAERHTRITAAPPVPRTAAAPTTFAGRNHVWIPSLGVDRSVGSFPCSRSTAPANYVYRWGCAGTNNVYLLGHAYGVFRPLHDAYTNGRLRIGLRVIYADGSGVVHTYTVQYWKVVKPTTSASWAWAELSTPGMTLQTCMGANSEYRLMVRLTRVD